MYITCICECECESESESESDFNFRLTWEISKYHQDMFLHNKT
jgi:hypothetical protein